MKDKITIGIFVDTFFPMTDGVIMVVDNYARRLIKYANVIVFAPSYIGSDFDDSALPYKVVRCYSLKTYFWDYNLPIPKLDKKFKKILDSYKLDIVHINSPFTLGKEGVRYAKKHNIPCVATMHSQYKQDFMKAVKNEWIANILTHSVIKVFNKCDECFAVNSEVARIYYEEYHYKCLPKVLNNATEMELVKDTRYAHKYINKLYNIKESDIVFLFVGRINTLKNIFFIVDSLKVLKEMKPRLRFKMLFVGSGQDEDKLKEKIHELDMDNNVIMCGKVTDRIILSYYYNRADLMLFPSVYDCSSIVQIEAASQKTPTVFLEGTATSATVTDNVNGYLSKYSVQDYANKIIEILDNKKLYKEVSENAYRDLYVNWDTVIHDVYSMYKEIIKNKNS